MLEPGVVEVFFDIELVLFEIAVGRPLDVDPPHLFCSVNGAPEVSEGEIDIMRNSVVVEHRRKFDTRFFAVEARKD